MGTSQQNETIGFMPERINRRPSVYRGMTFAELLLVMSGGAGIGAVIGIIVMFLFDIGWAIIPTTMGICGWLGTRMGGFYISRLKRGKPESWFERYIELKRSPSAFITTDQVWAIRRSKNLFERGA